MARWVFLISLCSGILSLFLVAQAKNSYILEDEHLIRVAAEETMQSEAPQEVAYQAGAQALAFASTQGSKTNLNVDLIFPVKSCRVVAGSKLIKMVGLDTSELSVPVDPSTQMALIRRGPPPGGEISENCKVGMVVGVP